MDPDDPNHEPVAPDDIEEIPNPPEGGIHGRGAVRAADSIEELMDYLNSFAR
jgi:hypothetical protein